MLIVFDWDGTLCDSTDKIVTCLQNAAREIGLPMLPPEECRDIIGLGMAEALITLYPDITAQQLEAMRSAYSRWFAQLDISPSPFYDGVEETLHELRGAGYALAIATGKSRRGLDRVLDAMGLGSFFHGSRCADETASKPDPRMLRELLGEFNRQAHESVMVGDTEYDMAMASALQVERVAVSYGAHEIGRLQKYQPALCIDHFPDIMTRFR